MRATGTRSYRALLVVALVLIPAAAGLAADGPQVTIDFPPSDLVVSGDLPLVLSAVRQPDAKLVSVDAYLGSLAAQWKEPCACFDPTPEPAGPALIPLDGAFDTSKLAAGEYTLKARVIDAKGRVAWAEPVAVVVHHKTAPVAEVLYPYEGQVVSGTIPIKVRGQSLAAAELLMDIEVLGPDPVYDPTPEPARPALTRWRVPCAGTAYQPVEHTVKWYTDGLPPGLYHVVVRSTDGRGITSYHRVSVKIDK